VVSDRFSMRAQIGLVAISLAATILAVVQWRELLHVLAGGTPFCAINEVLNCAHVWESDFAKAVHRLTHVPIAGWGFAWGVAALSSAVLLGARVRRNQPIGVAHAAVMACAATGVATSILLLSMSVREGVVCVMCIATYGLVALYAFSAWTVRPIRTLQKPQLLRGAGLASAFVIGAYLVVLYPGTRTPIERPKQLQAVAPGKDALATFLRSLPDDAQQSVADALETYQRSPVPNVSAYRSGFITGAKDAPVKVVEFFDIRCVHCKHFAEVLHELEATAPPGSLSIDLHLFPLDSTCNPTVGEMVDSTKVRCTAARALICLETTPSFRTAMDRLFAEQSDLLLDKVYSIVTDAGRISKDALDACMQSQETQAALDNDIRYASAYDIDGTPLVLANGRRATAIAPFLYALVLSHGDVRAPGWQVLPRPQADASR
jgi:serine/threonine-protein kinase